jgi:hypothetical protein
MREKGFGGKRSVEMGLKGMNPLHAFSRPFCAISTGI